MQEKLSFVKLKLSNLNFIYSRKNARKEIENYRKNKKYSDIISENFYIQSLRNYSKEDARYYHVAYSIMKGNDYSQIEKSCRKPLDPGKLFAILKDHHYDGTFKDVLEFLKIN